MKIEDLGCASDEGHYEFRMEICEPCLIKILQEAFTDGQHAMKDKVISRVLTPEQLHDFDDELPIEPMVWE